MEEVLITIGFTPKEARLYLSLLETGSQTAAELAKLNGEKRTNIYMLLESLLEKGAVIANDEQPIRIFSASDPAKLSQILQAQQERHLQASAALKAALPQLKIKYTLTNDKPGVTHISGIDGYKTLLDDMVRSKTEVLLVASDEISAGSEVLEELRGRLLKRKEAGVKTRAIFHYDALRDKHLREFTERGIELRFLGNQPFAGELAVYEDNVAFTVYEPSLIVTVITNKAIAQTMRLLFQELWSKAES